MSPPRDETRPGAILSPDEVYRYLLWRPLRELTPLDPVRAVLWVMLNPSTADAKDDDHTIRKVIGFSRRWGFNVARVVNLYSLRSTDWNALRTKPGIIGVYTDAHIENEARRANAVVLAWGGHVDSVPGGVERARAVRKIVSDAVADQNIGRPEGEWALQWQLGETKSGQPFHPLMIAYEKSRKRAHSTSTQDEQIERVASRIGYIVLEFLSERGVGKRFHAHELREYVDSRCPGAPGSADRILRDLRQRGDVDYDVVHRAESLYLITAIGR